ncbi:MAG: squalene/phytoene synthase family protein, partial [bacterium]|nr:squalene/phytoene synthase family protein [bacterium]
MREKLLITDILRDVSRSFYLSMRVLPYGMRAPVSLAYLIARAADTIADSPGTPLPVRLEILRLFKAKLLSFRPSVQAGNAGKCDAESSGQNSLGGISQDMAGQEPLYDRALHEISGATEGEKALLRYLPDIFRLLSCQKTFDREEICKVCSTLISGMEMDLTASGIFTAADLDRYTYLVAGCVGPFWTQMIARHTCALSKDQADSLEQVAVNFGKALQMTNILRDIPKDLANGRCYIPSAELGCFMGNIA